MNAYLTKNATPINIVTITNVLLLAINVVKVLCAMACQIIELSVSAQKHTSELLTPNVVQNVMVIEIAPEINLPASTVSARIHAMALVELMPIAIFVV